MLVLSLLPLKYILLSFEIIIIFLILKLKLWINLFKKNEFEDSDEIDFIKLSVRKSYILKFRST